MYLLFILLAVLIWGTDAAITKRFLFSALDPLPMITLRMAVSGVVLLPFIFKEIPGLRRLTRRQWGQLIALVLVATLAMNTLFYEGLVRTPSFIALILFRLEPVFVILISAIFLRQRASASTVLLTLATIAAGALVSLGGTGAQSLTKEHLAGVGLILLASVCSAVGTLLAKDLLVVISPLLLNGLRTLMAGLILFAAIGKTLTGQILPALSSGELILIFVMGTIYSAVAFWLYYKGLQRTAPLVGAQMQLLRMVSGLLASYVLLAEMPSMLQWFGSAALMVLLYVLTRPHSESARVLPSVATD